MSFAMCGCPPGICHHPCADACMRKGHGPGFTRPWWSREAWDEAWDNAVREEINKLSKWPSPMCSTSYPYLSFAQRYNFDYADVLLAVDWIENDRICHRRTGHAVNVLEAAGMMGELQRVVDAEHARRERVLTEGNA